MGVGEVWGMPVLRQEQQHPPLSPPPTCVTFQVFGSTVFSSGSEQHFKYLEKIYSLEVNWPCEL